MASSSIMVKPRMLITQSLIEAKSRPSSWVALKFRKKGKWHSINWQDFVQDCEQVGMSLKELNVKKGDKIAIMSNTRPEWTFLDMGILGLGAVTIPVYQSLSANDMAYILNDSHAKVLFVEDKVLLKKWQQIASQCPSIEKVVCIDSPTDLADDILTWDEFLEEGQEKSESQPGFFEDSCLSISSDDMATIVYTSGTTGLPKGVVLTHQQVHSSIAHVFDLLKVDHRDTSLSFLPYAHVLGRIESWGAVRIGFTLAFAESIERLKKNLVDIRPTTLMGVPRIFEKIYAGILTQIEAHPFRHRAFNWARRVGRQVSLKKQNNKTIPLPLLLQYRLARRLVFDKIVESLGGRIRFVVSGGAPLNKEIAEFFHASGIHILEGYGLSETTGAICVNTPYEFEFGTVGKAIGDVQIKIAPDGEILVKGDQIFREYHNLPDDTSQAFTDDGFFMTGDIGEWTKAGFLKITDRKKDLIKTAGGKYVASQKLSNLLKLEPLVSNVYIHGDQQKYIVALVTLDQANTLSLAKANDLDCSDYESLIKSDFIRKKIRQAVAQTNSQLASYESIKKFSILPKDFTVESGELTPSLKLKRKLISERYSPTISNLYN